MFFSETKEREGNMKKVAVLGSGGWGVALSLILNKNGHEVRLWSYSETEKNMINEQKRCKFLPEAVIPQEIKAYNDYESVLKDAEVVLVVTPSSAIRKIITDIKDLVTPNQTFVLCSKGMEASTQKIYTDVIKEILPNQEIAALSGPSHAEEVSRFIPTAVVIAAEKEEIARELQDMFMNDIFRVYINDDMFGVEFGGSLKNIIALACGISIGLGYGDNAIAALITRGLLEIARLGTTLGAKNETFYGLTGLGDLFVTCSSQHSRNRRCGILIGQGKTVEEAKAELGGMVVEGVEAVNGAYVLVQKYHIDAPIITEMYDIIHNGKSAKEAVTSLMNRAKKKEF